MKRSRIAPGRAGLRERQELRRLTAHSSRLWQIRDLQEGLQEILRASIELLNADKGSIHLVDDETGTLRIAAHRGFDAACLDHFAIVSARDGVACGRALLARDRIIIEDIREDTEFAPHLSVSPFRAVQSTPLYNADGAPIGVVSTHFSQRHKFTTDDLELFDFYVHQAGHFIERFRVDEALRESEERLRLAMQIGQLGTWDWDVRTGKVVWSEGYYSLQGYVPGELKPTIETWVTSVHPKDRPSVLAALNAARVSQADYVKQFRAIGRDGSIRWRDARGRFYYDETGEAVRMVGHTRDITAQKQSEQQAALLLKEVNHRSKNMLAMIQAIAQMTAKTSPGEFLAKFNRRLQGLAAAQDLLVKSEWREVFLRDVICAQLSGVADLIGTRVLLQGEDTHLVSEAAQDIAMAIHELATNAVKYGALSSPTGRVHIVWQVENSRAQDANLVLTWREEGGPPVAPPATKGFGSKVLEEIVSAALGGQVDLAYRPEGLRWQLVCPAARALNGTRRPANNGLANNKKKPAGNAGEAARVLVVEDEVLIALETSQALTDAGFGVLGPVLTVEEGLELLDRESCDAAILDVHLGDHTSEPIAHRLRAIGVPFIVLSGYDITQVSSSFAGARCFSKPPARSVLTREVHRMLWHRFYAARVANGNRHGAVSGLPGRRALQRSEQRSPAGETNAKP
ncbi:MAG TPA: HWE histidine kinase domain-containing protein [Rhizomicrobium sp.]|nr:HWE histidine kinase domain-containing protein [Rhizomicrobium sp.]